MSKITKVIADGIAKKVTANLKEQIDQCEKDMQVAVTDMLAARIPAEILVVCAKHPDYVKQITYVYLNSNGYRHRKVILTKSVPYVEGVYSYINDISNKEVVALDKIENKKDKLEEKYKRVNAEIRNTLLGLGTYARVKEQLPKIYPLLPVKSGSTALMLVPEQVRSTIDCLLSEEKKCLEKL